MLSKLIGPVTGILDKVIEDKEALVQIEANIDDLIADFEKQKAEIFSDPKHAEYAYVTYEDLENLPIWN